jgi:hypothetical protein
MACTMSGFFLPQISASSLLIGDQAVALLASRATARSRKETGERMIDGLVFFGG